MLFLVFSIPGRGLYMKKMVRLLCFLAVGICAQPKLSAEIYDCFIFYNELNILEIRLEELDPYVDKFVLVESRETFRGNEKPLYFAENKERFSKYLDKIIHVVVEDRIQTTDPWVRENYQRNQIMRGLKNCKGKDFILISDVDEIPKGSRIQALLEPLIYKKKKRVGSLQRLFFYYLNRYREDWRDWNGTTATRYAFLKRVSPQHLRDRRGEAPIIGDMGWHFTWMGGASGVRTKAYATPHDGYVNDFFTKDELINTLHLDHAILPMTYNNFPKCVVENQRYFREVGLLE